MHAAADTRNFRIGLSQHRIVVAYVDLDAVFHPFRFLFLFLVKRKTFQNTRFACHGRTY